MARQNLGTYLQDHLAGSVAALELLENLGTSSHSDIREFRTFLAELRTDIEADQKQLEAIMAQLNITTSYLRTAVAWFAEKAARVKFAMDDGESHGNFLLLESLEVLATGIEGKRCLWVLLDGIASDVPELRQFDFKQLTSRADEQRSRIEPIRFNAGVAALLY